MENSSEQKVTDAVGFEPTSPKAIDFKSIPLTTPASVRTIIRFTAGTFT